MQEIALLEGDGRAKSNIRKICRLARNSQCHLPFFTRFPEGALKESTVRGWKKVCLSELQSQQRTGKHLSITELPNKKLGHPLLLGETLEKELRAYLIELGKAGGVVNAEIAMASPKGLVKKSDSKLLGENGGHMFFTKDWAHQLRGRMRLVKRKANSKFKISVNDFEEQKKHFCAVFQPLF